MYYIPGLFTNHRCKCTFHSIPCTTAGFNLACDRLYGKLLLMNYLTDIVYSEAIQVLRNLLLHIVHYILLRII